MWVEPDRMNAAYIPSERLAQFEYKRLAFRRNADQHPARFSIYMLFRWNKEENRLIVP